MCTITWERTTSFLVLDYFIATIKKKNKKNQQKDLKYVFLTKFYKTGGNRLPQFNLYRTVIQNTENYFLNKKDLLKWNACLEVVGQVQQIKIIRWGSLKKGLATN